MQRLLASYRAIPSDATVRLAKPTSNLFRARAKTKTKGLDVSGLTGVIAVDPEARTADVAGMCTYEDLVAATLPYGLSPLVVPQLKTITLGGAVTGLGIESASFRNGLPHESVLEMDILTGAGDVVTASRDLHPDLFHAFPNSYGTLGYSVRLKIELETVKPFVALRHLRFSLARGLGRRDGPHHRDRRPRRHPGGLPRRRGVQRRRELSARWASRPRRRGPVSDYTGQTVYYRSIQHADGEKHDRLTIHDYLWRWDTDWFWCSRAFGAQNPRIRRLWPRRYRRSSFYWKLIAYDQRFNIADRIEKRNGRPPLERVVQDVEVPIGRTAEFLDWFLTNVPIEPIWLCPLRLRDDGQTGRCTRSARTTPTSTSASGRRCPSAPTEGHTNRLIERKVSELDGHKSLYSDAYYSPRSSTSSMAAKPTRP